MRTKLPFIEYQRPDAKKKVRNAIPLCKQAFHNLTLFSAKYYNLRSVKMHINNAFDYNNDTYHQRILCQYRLQAVQAYSPELEHSKLG